MLLHASRGGEHFTHKREKNENEKEHDKFNTTLYRTLQIAKVNYIYNTTESSASNARMSMANGRLACECEQRSRENASNARTQHQHERDRQAQKGYSTSKCAGVLLHASRGGETSDM